MIVGVVSLYNPTTENIRNIKNTVNYVDHFIIIDDSETSYKQVLEENIELSVVDYYWNQGNIGLCKSLNAGLRRALLLDADWILIIDQDSIIRHDVINIYQDYIDNNDVEDIALIAPLFNYDRHRRHPVKRVKKIPYADLSGCIYNAKAFRMIGLYDERFFTYCMDREWCLRAKKYGYKLIECGMAVIDHHPAQTKELKILDKVVFRYGQAPPKIYYYQFRGHLMMHKMYHDIGTDLFGVYKWLKALYLFDDKTLYKKEWKKAKEDFKRKYYGQYIE